MNLLLLHASDFIAPNRVRLNDYRFIHLKKIIKIAKGERIRAGLLNGNVGYAEAEQQNNEYIELLVKLTEPPPAALNVHLILALPRPKMLKRIFQTISAMGVKQLSLIHSARVEKSYWQTPWLKADKMNQHLILGLEQAQDTILAQVHFYQRFKPFAEDILPGLAATRQALVAHPGQGDFCLQQVNRQQSCILAVGPEGGFSDYEVNKFTQAGFNRCQMGERILRVENAVPVLLGRLLY